MFGWHTTAGSLLYYLIPIHVGGAMVHVLKGHAIFARITPGLNAAVKSA